MNKHLSIALGLSCFLVSGGQSWAQPGTPSQTPDAAVTPAEGANASHGAASPVDPYAPPQDPVTEAPAPSPKPLSMRRSPHLLAISTGHLLPAAVIESTTSLDTGGSFGGALRVGLGDVGEFGIETSPRIRLQSTANSSPETVQPLVLASFRMGVAEDRLFKAQPALALGFRKSFSRKTEGQNIRVAAIDFAASKSFGSASIHAGGVFWDAQMRDLATGDAVVLHDSGTRRQIRPFGGIEVEPIDNAQLLIDLNWVPSFSPFGNSDRAKIRLRPTLSWGIRSKLTERVSFESGVRVPDIGEANLLDAQIFGQLSWTSYKLRDALSVSE